MSKRPNRKKNRSGYQKGYGQASGSKAFTGHHRKGPGSSGRSNHNRYKKDLDISTFINKDAEFSQEKEKSFTPKHAFTDFALNGELKRAIKIKGYTEPTPIQDSIIPHILKGKDVVGIANTGTGKTAAFLIPLINKVLNDPREKVIVVTPTRELANQIQQELKKLTPAMGIFSVCCVGGTSIAPQIRNLGRKHNFVIGTPGRLKDLMERGRLDLSRVGTIVLDEADVMLDMGFINDMHYLIERMPPKHHTLLFSATMSKKISALTQNMLDDPVSISVKKGNTSRNVEQDVVRLKSGEHKIETLHSLLIQPDFDKVLVFGRTKRGVERLSRDLHRKGLAAESIHGNKNYNQRQKALAAFKENKVNILVATDVASRGLDIPNVSHVINYDMPNTYEDYIHRIGRTGRWGKKGKALTFV